MIGRILNFLRSRRDARALRQLAAFRQAEDLPSQALKIAHLRSLGTRVGGRCRVLGRVDALNPHLIEIGEKCVIGTETMLLANGPGFDALKKTVIVDYSYLGFRVTVLPGVNVGEGCIIGTGSIVTRDIPAGKVAAGNPARVLRDVTPEERADIRHRLDNDLFFGKEGRVV